MTEPNEAGFSLDDIKATMDAYLDCHRDVSPDVFVMTKAACDKLNCFCVQPSDGIIFLAMCGVPYEVFETVDLARERSLELVKSGNKVSLVLE